MTIKSGCTGCAFTHAVGTLSGDGVTLSLTASGKGGNTDTHLGTVQTDNARGSCSVKKMGFGVGILF
jgi:hypothetical protein